MNVSDVSLLRFISETLNVTLSVQAVFFGGDEFSFFFFR